MRFDVLTIFPGLFEGYLQQSLLKKAIDAGLVDIQLWNFRDWSIGKHQSVDHPPYGGGPGMLIRCEPVFECVEAVQAQAPEPGQLVMLTPRGGRSISLWSRNSHSTDVCCCCVAATKGLTTGSCRGSNRSKSRSAISSATAARCPPC